MTKLLFVCIRNRWRSPTAEKIFHGVAGRQARSAGTEAGARIRVNAQLIGWADVVFCMEKRHARRLRENFAEACVGRRIVCLDIPDDHRFMDPELIALLQAAVSEHL